MVLYIAYRDAKKMAVIVEHKLPEHIISIAKLGGGEKASDIYPIDPAAEAQPPVAAGGEDGEKVAADGGHKEREREYHRPQADEEEEVNRREAAV